MANPKHPNGSLRKLDSGRNGSRRSLKGDQHTGLPGFPTQEKNQCSSAGTELMNCTPPQPCILSGKMDIAQLRRAEQSIRTLESKLALHFGQPMFGVIEFVADLKISDWNPTAEVIFGYKRDEVIGRDARDLIMPHDLRLNASALFGELWSETGGRFATSRNVTKWGEELICEWFTTPLKRENGTVSGMMCLVRDVTAEKNAQASLAASESMLCAIFQSTEDTIWTVDAQRFALIVCNSAFWELFAKRRGYEVRYGMTPDDLAPAEMARWWKASYQRVLQTGAFETDYETLERTDVYHLSFNPLFRAGNVFAISVFGRNITARRRAEQELQRSLARYEHLIASSKDWVWETDAEGRYSYSSPQCREILGYEPDEIIGRTRFELMPVEDASRVRRLLHSLASDRKPFRALESTFLHKDGSTVILDTNVAPIIDQQHRFCGCRGMSRDITGRKRAEETLRESESRLHLALESGRMYVFEWDIVSDVMRRSSESASVLGFGELPMEESGRQFLQRIHPDDRASYLDALRELTPSRDTYLTSFRKLLPNRRTCWIEARGRGFFDEKGGLLRIIGIASDITETREAEEARRKLSARLINAQEEERKRFARELHDGVSQALSLISIEVAQAAKAAGDATLSAKLDRLYEKVQDVTSEIGQLSHKLHPSTLKHLGLTAAIRYLCREISEAHGIDVEFTDQSEQQSPSKDVSLCLYRIAQEALRNVIKHSASKKAWVELNGTADRISLRIRDQGVGFDIRSHKNGLGLVSMRERLRLVGGRISISSGPNSGTRIEAHVPVAPAVKAAA